MTTSVKVQSHNYPALVTMHDQMWDTELKRPSREWRMRSERVLLPEEGERAFNCWVGQEIRVTDIEYEDPRALAAKAAYVLAAAENTGE